MPSKDLTIALIPHDIILGHTDENLNIINKRLCSIRQNTDIVVLPELFSTGFITDKNMLTDIAESNNGTTITTVKQWSNEYNFGICGSFLAKEDDRYYNRCFFVQPDGNTDFYDKRHLFRAGGENEIYSRGHNISPVIKFRSWNIKLAICYDIRFPVWNRNIANNYDILIVPANWAHARLHAWKHMLMARAIENQTYVAGCNRSGFDKYGEYPESDSFIFDHMGYDIAEYQNDFSIYATLSADRLNMDRSRFSPWRDADKFLLTPD